MLPLPPPINARCATVLLLMLLALSLTGCATCPSPTPSPIVVEAPKLPAAPPMTEPAPSESYSLRAARNMKIWRERLEAIFGTP